MKSHANDGKNIIIMQHFCMHIKNNIAHSYAYVSVVKSEINLIAV